MLLLLLACVAGSPAGGDPGSADAGSLDSADTGDTGDSGDSGDSARWLPPAWMAEAARFTVPADRGLSWEMDEDFSLDGYAVPQVFVAPDGRFGLLATAMDGRPFEDRLVLWSDDGLSWEEGGALLSRTAFPYTCGERQEDAAVWREDADTWTFLFEGTSLAAADEWSSEPRCFCAATTSDLETWSFDDAAMWCGSSEDDRISVPAVLPFAAQAPHLWYNGDLMNVTEAGPGIRLAELETGTHDVEVVVADPMLPPEHVDPMPVWREGGGVRLYHTRFVGPAGTTGLHVVELDDDLQPTGDDLPILSSPGLCTLEPSGACYMDPAFLALDDGTLLLYFTVAEYSDESIVASVRRAVATD